MAGAGVSIHKVGQAGGDLLEKEVFGRLGSVWVQEERRGVGGAAEVVFSGSSRNFGLTLFSLNMNM